MSSSDYLDAAKHALGDAIDTGRQPLVGVANAHALIAVAETLRAILGAIVAIEPEEEGPTAAEEGWRDGDR